MSMDYDNSNHFALGGKVASNPKFIHEISGEKFYIFDLSVPHLTESPNTLPLTISEKLMKNEKLQINKKIIVNGKLKCSFGTESEKSKLSLIILAEEIKELENNENGIQNEVDLVGYICAKPIYRLTPFGRNATTILLSIKKSNDILCTEYIPCTAYGAYAKLLQNVETNTKVKIKGTIGLSSTIILGEITPRIQINTKVVELLNKEDT